MSIVQWLWEMYPPNNYLPRAQRLKIPHHYAHAQVSEKSLQLICEIWQIGAWGQYRRVCIQTPKMEVVNAFFFPHCSYQLPILALQAVVLTQQPQIMIIDMPFLIDMPTEVSMLMAYQQSRSTVQDLLKETPMPDWYQQCRSAHDIFCRPQNWAETQRLCHAYVDVAKQFGQWIPQAMLLDSSYHKQHDQQLQFYKDFHRLHSSGLKFLQINFGAEWAEHFLNYFYA
ncbi:MAG: hypothetical protein RIT27_1628 [Pseudomonadota bacterium]|jgi:hypothetical protein